VAAQRLPWPAVNTDVSVSLTYAAIRTKELQAAVTRDGAVIRSTSQDLDRLGARLERLRASSTPLRRSDESARRRRANGGPSPRQRWHESVEEARAGLTKRGIDPDAANLDELLDPALVASINRRHNGGFTASADLDRYDVLVAIAAGLAGFVVDALVVRTPSAQVWQGRLVEGSPLTDELRKLSIGSDNWLANWAKVAYDRVRNLPEPVAGLGPRTHRIHTLGHDPLFGLVFGTIDNFRGTMTTIGRDGRLHIFDSAPPETSLFTALAKAIVHLFSDVATTTGLPLPGWVPLTGIPLGRFGPNSESLGETARRMYLDGYNSWHGLTMLSSVGTVEAVLHSYWALRSHLDENWRSSTDVEVREPGTTPVRKCPRFAAMALIAHGVATAGNLAKFGASGNNPLALNYPQWCALLHSLHRWITFTQATPAHVMDARVRANVQAIAAGWARADRTVKHFGAGDRDA
jgi:hypothetical protein